MRKNIRLWLIAFGFLLVIILLGGVASVYASELGQIQIPTVSVPTVTSSPVGAFVTVTRDFDQVNVRGGPGGDGAYPVVGVLIAGQQVPALGRSEGGLWIQIAYPGAPGGVAWIYTPLVEVSGSLPIVEPPPTPTPRTTPTIDPTLAAQFIIEIPPTHLPTFTPPPPLSIPTFSADVVPATERVPMGLVIIGMGLIGMFGLLISLLRGR